MSLRIDGKKISSDIKEELKVQVKLLKEEGISVWNAVRSCGAGRRFPHGTAGCPGHTTSSVFPCICGGSHALCGHRGADT